MSLFRRKSLDSVTVHEAGRRLVPTLSWPHLIALGIGAIVGTGIYTLIGVGANLAGPAVLISFAIAGAVCACAALSYAELSTMMPAAGSAYTYSYSALGEVFAWVVGWSLILEYSLVVSGLPLRIRPTFAVVPPMSNDSSSEWPASRPRCACCWRRSPSCSSWRRASPPPRWS